MADALDFTEKQTILAVDDTPENLQLIHGLLKDDYRVKIANRGEAALKIAATLPMPDSATPLSMTRSTCPMAGAGFRLFR